jgi:hypothetical protein
MTASIYDTNMLGGYEAKEALDEYINRLENGKVGGLTKEQVYSVIRIAKLLRKTVSKK